MVQTISDKKQTSWGWPYRHYFHNRILHSFFGTIHMKLFTTAYFSPTARSSPDTLGKISAEFDLQTLMSRTLWYSFVKPTEKHFNSKLSPRLVSVPGRALHPVKLTILSFLTPDKLSSLLYGSQDLKRGHISRNDHEYTRDKNLQETCNRNCLFSPNSSTPFNLQFFSFFSL